MRPPRFLLVVFIVVHLLLQLSAFLVSLDDRVVATHPGYSRLVERRVAVADWITLVAGIPFTVLLWSLPLKMSASGMSGSWTRFAESVYTQAWPLWMVMNTAVWSLILLKILRKKETKPKLGSPH